jgi:glycosyltransferase involved in cell wall biosynthesis
MERYRIGIVIPAFNESTTIREIVNAVKIYGIPIVVNDGSTDDTAGLAAQAGAIVVSHPLNQGYDSALNSGFIKANELACEVVITLDADGQHDPSLVQHFIDYIDKGADIVVGLRSRKQRFSEHLFAWYTTLRFQIKDPLCGMKAYRISVYKDLGYFDSYGSIGTQLMLFAAKHKCKIDQIPFIVKERDGKSRFGQLLSSNLKILRAMAFSISRI